MTVVAIPFNSQYHTADLVDDTVRRVHWLTITQTLTLNLNPTQYHTADLVDTN